MSDKRKSLLPLIPADQIQADLAGKILNIHRITANSPHLLNASAPLRNYLVKENGLTDRQRELLILRLAHRLDSTYEWTHHVARGRAAGLTDGEIERVKQPPTNDSWHSADRIVLQLVDEMLDEKMLSIPTAEAALTALGNDGLVDAVFTAGYYIALGTLLKTFDVPLEPSIEPLSPT